MDTNKRGRVRMNIMQVNGSCCFSVHLNFVVQCSEILAPGSSCLLNLTVPDVVDERLRKR